jgi:hypothetical protein
MGCSPQRQMGQSLALKLIRSRVSRVSRFTLGVPAIGLGCMSMSFGCGPAGDKQEMISLSQPPRHEDTKV